MTNSDSAPGAASAYSAAQYFSYAFNHDFTFNARGEIYRDDQNFFVSTPTDNSGGSPKGEIGITPISATLGGTGGQGTTYASGTLGVTFKPDVPKPFALFMVRPEIRYDSIVSGASLFGAPAGTTAGQRGQFLFGGDIVLGF